MRLSIEITELQHQAIKSYAVLHGQSIKDFVLEKVLTDELRNFNETTSRVLAASEAGKGLHKYNSVDDFISEMDDA